MAPIYSYRSYVSSCSRSSCCPSIETTKSSCNTRRNCKNRSCQRGVSGFIGSLIWYRTAQNEQYVYYDASKGDLDEVSVSVGDKVSEGQALVKYSSTEAQATYDAASRAVAKADRHTMNWMRLEIPPQQHLCSLKLGLKALRTKPQHNLLHQLQLLSIHKSVMRVMFVQTRQRNLKSSSTVGCRYSLSTVEGTVVKSIAMFQNLNRK